MSSAAYPKGWLSGADRRGSTLRRPDLRDGTTCFAANSEQLAAVLMKEAARRREDRARARPADHVASGPRVHAERLSLDR